MHRVTKGLAAALAFLLLLFCLASCDTAAPKAPSAVAATAPASIPAAPATGAEIALLASEETAESEHGQAVWSAVSRVAGELAATSGLYRTAEGADEKAALATMELAVKGGARLVLLLGADLAPMAMRALRLYPDVDFILLDMPYDTPLSQNAVLVRYSPEESGWLAGYASVYEELGSLGFLSPQTEEESRYLLGFLLGADAAAQDRKAQAGSVQAYALAQGESTEAFLQELRVLYQPGGAGIRTFFAGQSAVLEAALPVAKEAEGYLAGPAPLPGGGETLLAGVTHNPENLLSALLAGWTAGRFPGGDTVEGTVAGGEIGLELPKEGLGRFGEQRYQTVLDRFRIGGLSTDLARKTAPDGEGKLPLPEELDFSVLQIAASLAPPAGAGRAGSSVSAALPEGGSSAASLSPASATGPAASSASLAGGEAAGEAQPG